MNACPKDIYLCQNERHRRKEIKKKNRCLMRKIVKNTFHKILNNGNLNIYMPKIFSLFPSKYYIYFRIKSSMKSNIF